MTILLDAPETQTDPARYEEGRYDGVLQTLGKTGDARIMWDRRNPAEVAMAKSAFNKARKDGMMIYRAEGKEGIRGEQIRDFDPDAERLIAVPQLQGG